MQKVTGVIILTINLVFCADALSADLVQDVQTGEHGLGEWAAQNYDTVVKHVFGEPSSADLPSPDMIWIVTARIHPAHDEAGELQFSLSKTRDGKVGAELIRVMTPLLVQIDEIHRQHPDLDAAAVAKLIRLERRAIEATSDAPALVRLAKTFEALRPLIAVENAMVLDPRRYQVWIDAGSQQVVVNLLGPSSGDGRHALIRWVENAQRELCRELAETLAFAVSMFSQDSKPIKSLSLQEYETIVEEVLPCPVAHLADSRDFYLCMTIMPPGHRSDERELLVVLTSSAENIELVLRRPEQAIWRFASEAYVNNEAEWRSLPGLQLRELRISDRIAIERIVGRPWRHLVTDVVPRGDLFADPTT